ncbi:MAG: AMIN domain-containing protein [Calothrix sp. MO_167.B42]|nr:AMIN domain-containing protein [Calothrix sp. MO_167.B42]
MKYLHGKNIILGTAGLVMLMAQPVWANATKVTDVQLKPTDGGGIQVILKTASGSRPQIFTTKRGNNLVTDIINTQLTLGQGNSFSQKNPAPGIASVTINQLDANSIRLVVTGNDNVLNSEPVKRGNNEFTISFTPGSPTQPGQTTSTQPSTPLANQPPTSKPSTPAPMVPNPKVTIDGKPAPTDGIAKSPVPAPPFLPRAVAPPVGDMAIGNLDASPSSIDLGTQERVPRLVLRDAPVREVLSLLARAAGLNLAYIGGSGDNASSSGTISLDIENEPVQDVFNYVLRLSSLEANRRGRTIFVGAKLPNAAKDLVMRNVRLNQVKIDVALNFLVGMGAESAINVERTIKNVVSKQVGDGAETQEQEEATIKQIQPLTLKSDSEYTTPVLQGLQALGDIRTNSVTLIGSPKLVGLAMAQLTQLDVRRRQVAVNVKIIDVNLSNVKDLSSSFSFGIGNNFFVNDGGNAVLNFNGSRPATSAEALSSTSDTPVIDADNPDNPLEFPKRLLATLQAQVVTGNAKILTDPTLIVQEGQEARVNLTQEVVGKITTTFVDTDSGSREVREPTKEDVGLTLGVKVDRVDDNGFVSLSVAPSIKAPTSVEETGDGGSVTLISERSLSSGLVRLRDGQTLVLSGIIQDQDRVSVSKIPILGDIPLLGSLFRSSNKTNERTEVIVLLTPQIMDDSQRSSYGYNYKPSPDARQMLKRGGLNILK